MSEEAYNCNTCRIIFHVVLIVSYWCLEFYIYKGAGYYLISKQKVWDAHNLRIVLQH